MTQIQASVNVKDNVDSKIEQKIKAIGIASATTAQKLNTLKNAVSSLSSRNINGFSTAVATLGRTNFNGLVNQMRQLAQVSSQLNGSFSQTALQATKLQIAQTKLQQEQTKSSILTVRLQREQQALSNAQNQGAISASNLANAQARANTAQIRSQIASTQAITATIRLQREQARLEQQLQRNAQASANANIGLRQFVGTMFALASAGATLVGIAQLGDQYQSMINKLTMVTDNAEQARNRLASLTEVAKSSYSDLQSTTQLYTRLDMALKQMGGTSSEAMQITQTLTKTVSLAGLTTAEASSALLQISQAFNKGKLDGDEFRTVMETMPPLADALATKLKTNRGELLKLAPLGKITGDVMKQAVIEMAETVDQKFAKMTPTVAMYLQNLQTEAQTYFGAMFKDTGLAETFGNAIKYIANNLELATKVAIAFGIAVGASFAMKGLSSAIVTIRKVGRAFSTATTAVDAFTIATRVMPIGWLITGISALTLGLDYLFDTGIGKSIFPQYDQDKARMDDYFSRLKDINSQMDLMSFTKLGQESAILEKNMAENNKTIEQTKRELDQLEKQIANNEKTLKRTSSTMKTFEGVSREMLIMSSSQTMGMDVLTDAEIKNAEAKEKSIQLNSNYAEKQRELEELEKNREQGLRSQLKNTEEQIERIKQAEKAISDKSKTDIEANEQLKAQNDVYQKGIKLLPDLEDKVRALRAELQRLVGMDADLSAPINEVADTKTNDLMIKTEARIKAQIARQKEWASATKDRQLEMGVEDRNKKDLELFANGNKEQKKLGEKLLKELVEAEKAVEARKKADAEAERNVRKRAKTAESEAKKRENERRNAIEKQEQYVGKLNDELVLLKEGYQNYSKYNSLYSLRLELQQKGVTLTEQQMNSIKAKIDAVEREKELAKEINTIEENSLARQQEQWRLKMNALSKANVTQTDRQIGVDNEMGAMGVTYGVEQGLVNLTAQYEAHYQRIQELRRLDYLNDEQHQMALQTLDANYQDAIYAKRLENLHAMGGMYDVVATAFESFTQNATNNLMSVLNGTKSISDAMRDLASTILNSVVQSIIEMGVKWVAQQVMQMAFGEAMMATQLATSTAMASAMASAWATPATLVSLASYGANAPPAMAGMASTLAMAQTMAVAGARRNGGNVNAGDLYQVGEGNAPEIYQSRTGRQYMIAGDNGRVFSNKQVTGSGGKVVNVTQNITINGDGKLDADTLSKMREQTRAVVYEVLTDEHRDAGGMFA